MLLFLDFKTIEMTWEKNSLFWHLRIKTDSLSLKWIKNPSLIDCGDFKTSESTLFTVANTALILIIITGRPITTYSAVQHLDRERMDCMWQTLTPCDLMWRDVTKSILHMTEASPVLDVFVYFVSRWDRTRNSKGIVRCYQTLDNKSRTLCSIAHHKSCKTPTCLFSLSERVWNREGILKQNMCPNESNYL